MEYLLGVAQLTSAVAQGNEMYTSQAARDTAHGLKHLTNAIRVVASTSDTPEVQRTILNSGQEVLRHSSKLINEAQKSLQTVGKYIKTFFGFYVITQTFEQID